MLGITDNRPRRVIGTHAFSDPVEMARKVFEHIGFRVDIEAVMHPHGRVVVFHIPGRPRGTAYRLKGLYLMRSGDALVPMSEDRLRSIFAEGRPECLEEYSRINLSQAEIVALLDTQRYFELFRVPYPTHESRVIDHLVNHRLVDESAGLFAIRRIGAPLFAKRLEEFPDLARKAARVVVYHGSSKIATKLDRPATMGYAVGFQGLVRFVVSQLPQNEVVEDALRKQVKLVPEIVIREVLANALIHQDFTMQGTSVMVEIYDNRVEVSNPGEPIVEVNRFIDGYQSRNERLADLMRRAGICEEKGSGIDKVVHAAEAYQLPAPDIRVVYRRTLVTIFGPKEFEDMDRDDRIRACYQHCALKYVMEERMTNQSLRARFHLPESKTATVSQVIGATIEAGLIKLDPERGTSRKYARYLPFWVQAYLRGSLSSIPETT